MNKLKKTLALLLSLVMILSLLPAVAFADGEEQPAQLPEEEISEIMEEEAQAEGETVTVTKEADDFANSKVSFLLGIPAALASDSSKYNLQISFDKAIPAGGVSFYINQHRTTAGDEQAFAADTTYSLLGDIVKSITVGTSTVPVDSTGLTGQYFAYLNGYSCGVEYTSNVPAGTTMTIQVVKDGTSVGSSISAVLNPVAAIDSTNYATLDAAWKAAQNGDTITLVDDITFASDYSVQVWENKNFNLNLNGHTITTNSGVDTGLSNMGYKASALCFSTNSGSVKISNGSIVTAYGAGVYADETTTSVTLEDLTITASKVGVQSTKEYSSAVRLTGGATVVINSGSYSGANGAYAIAVSNSGGQVTVNGGTFNGDIFFSASTDAGVDKSITINGGNFTGNFVNPKKGTLVITGGTFTADPSAYVPEGYEVVNNGNGTWTVKAYVAQIGEEKYTTLEAAVAAAQDGQTITLLSDCEGNGIVFPQGKFANGLTIDFDDHTYSITGTPVGSKGTETLGMQLLKDNKITLKNGTITGSSKTNRALQRIIQNYADLTLDNMTLSLEGQYYDQITMSNCNGEIAIKDSTVNAPDFTWAGYSDSAAVGGVAMSVGTFSTYNAVNVEVTGNSTINGDVAVDPTNENATNTLTLTSGNLTGNILMKDNAATDATVTKADTFTQTAPEGFKWVDNGNGTSTLDRPAAINFLGGSLRRRVRVGTEDVVYDETDIRFGFTISLPKGATIDKEASYFTWGFDAEQVADDYGTQVVMRNVTDNGDGTYTANLVITGVPQAYFDYDLYAKLHVNYTLNGNYYPADMELSMEGDEPIHRSVRTVCESLKELYENDTTNIWYEYASALLNNY